MLQRIPLAALLVCATLGSSQAADLLTVYHAALENDPQLHAAAAQRDAARLQEPLARARLLPAITLNSGVNAIHSDSDHDRFSHTNASLGIALTHPLYHRDRQLQREQARDQGEQAETRYSAAAQGLMIRVASAYFTILAAEDNLGFVRAQKSAIDRQLEQAKQRFEVGLIAITAVHEAQAVSDQASANLIHAANQLDNAREALREILHSDLTASQRLAATIPLEIPAPADSNAWSELALNNSPAVQAAAQGLEIARKEIEVQRSARYPAVDLVAAHNIDRNSGNRRSDLDSSSIGVRLSVPLWLGGSIATSTEQSRYRFEEARQQLDQQRRRVNREVRDAYRAVEAGISSVHALQASIVSARSALEATQAGFDVGTRTMVDVLNAEQNLYGILSAHATARYNYLIARLQLRQAAGVLSEADLAQVNQWLK